MARLKPELTGGDDSQLEEARQREFAKLREKARRMADVLVRTKDPDERYRELLHANLGLTAAMEAQWGPAAPTQYGGDEAEWIAHTTDHCAFWPMVAELQGTCNENGFYSATADEVRQIAREELEAARLGRPT